MEFRENFQYTEEMERIFFQQFSQLKTYYCREDTELALNAVKKAKKDAVKFRKRELKKLCDARELDMEKLLEDDSLLESIPTRKEIQENLLQAFYDMYLNFPRTTDFMGRIVRRLAPEYKKDSIRVAILKKFLTGAGKNFKRFKIEKILEWGKKKCGEEEQKKFRTLTKEKQREFLVSKMDDSIFIHTAAELTSTDLFKLIVNRMKKSREDEEIVFDEPKLLEETKEKLDKFFLELVDEKNLEEEVFCETFSVYEKLNLIYEMMEQGKVQESDVESGISSFIELLEQDFRNQMKNVTRRTKTGMVSNVADLYKNDKKDARKKAIGDWELLKLCDDLAKGNFRPQGKTKVYLYYFAIMFDMTFSLNQAQYDPIRDIEKNLFHDYYNDNLLRILEGDYANTDTNSTLEKEPTGEGINYKSFVEMIYLYFIFHKEFSMTPGERLDAAEKMIEECIKKARKKGNARKISADEYTREYKNRVKFLFDMERDKISDYIVENYLVIPVENVGATRIMAASEENRAFDYMTEIMDDLNDYYSSSLADELTRTMKKNDFCFYEQMKADIHFSENPLFDWEIHTFFREKFPDDVKFLKLIAVLDERMRIDSSYLSSAKKNRMIYLLNILVIYSDENSPLSMYKIQARLENKKIVSVGTQISDAIAALSNLGYDILRKKDNYYLGKREYEDEQLNEFLNYVKEPYLKDFAKIEKMFDELLAHRLFFNKRVSRSELISMYLNYYVTLLEDSASIDTFPDVFEDFESVICPVLEEARYQPLSEKNILDMYVITALYFYFVEHNGYMDL